jgi:hypothetical protein
VLGETPPGLLGENQFPVDLDLEHAPAAGDQFTRDAVPLIDGIRQTGGRGLVISDAAVLDADAHGWANS